MNSDVAPYLDQGRPVLRTSITGFLDVLGFSHVATTAASLEESQRTLERIAAAIRDSRDDARRHFPLASLGDRHRSAVKFFSDNLVFGIPIDHGDLASADAAWFAVRCVQFYQLRMALAGFFVRGALTKGEICLTDEIIFGAALVECYRLESKASIVPRAILDEPLRNLLLNAAPGPDPQRIPGTRDWICRDIDKWWFVNYLEAAVGAEGVDWTLIERHKESVLRSLANTTQHDVLPKFGWACRYHNVFCHWHRGDPGYSDRYRIERSDEQSTISRISDLPMQSP